jgi:glycoprotein-N-acetylgalactosamine 3-beta-galactosyltransferase
MAVASTWGAHCDGFLAFSNVSDSSIPTVVSSYEGTETYWNLWQKKVFMYEDVWEHFKDDFDFFFFGDDDTFVRVDHLRIYLEQLRATHAPGVYAGRRIRIGAFPDEYDFDYFYNSGGGYVLDREALGRLTEVLGRETSDNSVSPCKDGIGRTSNGTADVHTSRCLRAASPPVLALDTRDCQGKERFHHLSPALVSTYTGHENDPTGNHYAHHSTDFRPFLEGVAPSTIVFHLLKKPEYMSQTYTYLKYCRGTHPKNTDDDL